jgi:hypothetical protein
LGKFNTLEFIKTAPENPVLWTGMKAEKINQMLKQVQHDMPVRSVLFVIPNLFRDLGFGF